MKTQLLQDLDESRVDFVARPAAALPTASPAAEPPVAAMPSAPAPPTAAPSESAPAAPVPPAPVYAAPRAAVWSFKDRPSAPEATAPPPEAPKSTLVPAPELQAALDGGAPEMVMPKAIIWPSDQPDAQANPALVAARAEPEPPLVERVNKAPWVALGMTALMMVAAGAYWLHRESKIDDTMALLATKGAPAPSAFVTDGARKNAPSAVAVPASEPVAASIGSEALATPQPAAPAPAPAPTRTPEAAAAALSPSEMLVLDKSAAQPERAPVMTAEPASKHPVVKAPQREKAAAVEPPQREKAAAVPPPQTAPGRVNDMAETLRQCRAMGYHETQCIERGCYTTKYGLVCKG